MYRMYTAPLTFEEYLKPKTVDDAVSALARYGKEAKFLAGGTDLINLVRHRALVPKCVIDLTEIPGLDYVRVDEEGSLMIGALTTLKAVGRSPVVNQGWPILCEAVCRMGTTQLRNMGTVVGNLCRASPSADTASTLLVLEASLEITTRSGTRAMPLQEFFIAPGKTALNDDEIVTEICVPKLQAGTGTAFLKLTRVAEDLAKVNVATVLTVQNSICKDARIALGGVTPIPIRAMKAEEILRGNHLDDKIIVLAAKAAANETTPITDVRSTAEYRKELSNVLVIRALKISWERRFARKNPLLERC